MKNPEQIPEWLAKGIMYLLTKTSETILIIIGKLHACPLKGVIKFFLKVNIQTTNFYHNRNAHIHSYNKKKWRSG